MIKISNQRRNNAWVTLHDTAWTKLNESLRELVWRTIKRPTSQLVKPITFFATVRQNFLEQNHD